MIRTLAKSKKFYHINDFTAIFARTPPLNRTQINLSNLSSLNHSTDPYDKSNYMTPIFISHYDYVKNYLSADEFPHDLNALANHLVFAMLRNNNRDIIQFPDSDVITDAALRKAMMYEAFTGGRSSQHHLLFVETGIGQPQDSGNSTLTYTFKNESLLGTDSLASLVSKAFGGGNSIGGKLAQGLSTTAQALVSNQFYAPGAQTSTEAANKIFGYFSGLMQWLQDRVSSGYAGINLKTMMLPQITVGYADRPNPAFYIKVTKIAYQDAYTEILPMFEWLKMNFGVLTIGVFSFPCIVYSKDLTNMLLDSRLPFVDPKAAKETVEVMGTPSDLGKEIVDPIGDRTIITEPQTDSIYQSAQNDATAVSNSNNYYNSDIKVSENEFKEGRQELRGIREGALYEYQTKISNIAHTQTEIFFVALPESVTIKVSDYDYSDRIYAEHKITSSGERSFYRRIDVTFSFKLAVPFIYNVGIDLLKVLTDLFN